MQIAAATIVTLNFTLTDEEGNVLDQSIDGSFTYLHGAGRIIRGLEAALAGRRAGDNVDVVVPPAEAFGERIADLTEIAPRRLFKGLAVKPGMQFQARDKSGKMVLLTVVRVAGDDIHVDANHPLAGQTLYFNVDILAVRAATPAELGARRPAGEAEPQ